MGMALPLYCEIDPHFYVPSYVEPDEEFELWPGFRKKGGGTYWSPCFCIEPVHDMASDFEQVYYGEWQYVNPRPSQSLQLIPDNPVCLCGNRMVLQCPGTVKCVKCGRERQYIAVDHIEI